MGHGIEMSWLRFEGMHTCSTRIESEFAHCLVHQAALVLIGEKPAALFSFCIPQNMYQKGEGEARDRSLKTLVTQLFVTYEQELRIQGIRLTWLSYSSQRLMLLVWRPVQCARLWARASADSLKHLRHLAHLSPCQCSAQVIFRLRSFYMGLGSFPHEIGLMLGYPPEDVVGFIQSAGKDAKAQGLWKVYGNPLRARMRFAELARLESWVKRLYSQGASVSELLRLAAA